MIDLNYDLLSVLTESGVDNSVAELHMSMSDNGFQVDISASKPITKIILGWKRLMQPYLRVLGDHWERGYGDLEWRGFVFDRVMPWYVLICDPASKKTYGLGVKTGAGSFASWQVDEASITLNLDVRNGNKGVALGDRVLCAANVVCMESMHEESAFAFAHRFCKSLCEKPCLPKFPVYGGNDWYYAYGNNSADSIRNDAQLIRDLSPSAVNAPFMVIDAGWFPAQGCAGGPYDVGNSLFPDMPGLAQQMVDINVRPGIWIRPLLTQAAPESWKLPVSHPITQLEKGAVLDPSVPEVLELVKADIARLASWGYELIKHDFTTYDLTGRWGFDMMTGEITSGDWHFADRTRTTAEIITSLYQAIRDAAGESILIGCNTVGHLGAGLFELQRTGDDTSGKEWSRTRKMGINTLAFRMTQHNAFFAADADCVGLTNDVPWHLNRQWLDLLAKSGTPLFVSADPKAVGSEQRTALKMAFEIAATQLSSAEPLDWMNTTCPRTWKFGDDVQEFEWG